MANKPVTCPTMLRLLLSYDAEAGTLTWNSRPRWMFKGGRAAVAHKIWNKRFPGKTALDTPMQSGHRSGGIFGVTIYAHRAAMAVMNGAWPECEVDHINGNPSDNRACNLRECSSQENKQNRAGSKLSRISAGGYCGVIARGSKWRAIISIPDPSGGRSIRRFLGTYSTEIEAAKAYDAAAIKYFGAFARPNFVTRRDQ